MSKGGESAGKIRISIHGGVDSFWTVAVKRKQALPRRVVPGCMLTKVHCDREVQLRLTRVIQSPSEQLGFYTA